jgi:ketosteroid isomerase-like protein
VAATPEQNVELLGKFVDAYNRRDIEAVLGVFHPEAEWYPLSALAEGDQAYQGHEGIRQWWANQDATFDELRLSVDEVRDLGDVVLALGRLSTRSKSGITLDTDLGCFLQIRHGLATYGRAYPSHAEALKAVEASE